MIPVWSTQYAVTGDKSEADSDCVSASGHFRHIAALEPSLQKGKVNGSNRNLY